MASRLESNRKIVAKLSTLVEQFPDWRFQQILQNAGVVEPGSDQWYEESDHTLKTIETMTKPWQLA